MADEITISVRAEDNFSGVLSNFGNIITGIRSAVDLAADAFRAAADFVGLFVNSASESQQAVFELEAVLRATGGAAGFTSEELQNMADHLQGVTRFSDEAVLSGVSMLLTFRNIGEETFPRATNAMLDMATMFGSVDSAAVQLGKALNDPIAGIGALQRIGIQFTEEQKEMIQNFMDMGDIAGAQNIILKEVEMQIGGLALAMGETFAGKIDILKNKFDSLKEGIGGLIIHALTPLLDSIIGEGFLYDALETLINAFGTVNERVGAGLPFLQAVAMTLMELPEHSDLLATLPPVLEDIANAMMTMQSALDNGQSGFDAFMTSLDFLAREGGPLSGLATQISTVLSAINEGDWAVLIDIAITGLGDLANRIDAAVAGAINEGIASGQFRESGDAFGQLINSMLSTGIESQESQAAPAIAEAISQWFLAAAGVESWQAFGQFWIAFANFMEVEGTNAVRDFFNNWEVSWTNAIRDFMNDLEVGITDGIRDFFNNWEMDWTNWVREHIVDPIKRALGIASPSAVFMEIGRNIISGLVLGINMMLGSLLATGLTVAATFVQAVGDKFGELKDRVATVFSEIKQAWDDEGLSGVFQYIGEQLNLDGGVSISGYSPGGGLDTGGTTGGRSPGTGDTRDGGTSGSTVTNIYNFYGTVYMSNVGPEGTYDCEYPNPIISGTTGGRLVTSGLG